MLIKLCSDPEFICGDDLNKSGRYGYIFYTHTHCIYRKTPHITVGKRSSIDMLDKTVLKSPQELIVQNAITHAWPIKVCPIIVLINYHFAAGSEACQTTICCTKNASSLNKP